MMRLLVSLFVIFSLLAPLAHADAERRASREREQLRRVQSHLQQAQAQLSALEQEKARMARNLTEAEKARDAARGRLGRLNRDLAQERQQRETLRKDLDLLRQESAELKSQLDQTRTRLTETQAILAETQVRLRETDVDKHALEGVKARQEREIALCEDKNRMLYQVGRDLMARYENKDFEDVLKQREPFTGIKQVEIENLLEEYRDKLDEQKIIKQP